MRRKALITGAGSGMGRAIAIHLNDAGYYVIAADMNEESVKTLSEDCGVRYIRMDVSSWEDVYKGVSEIGGTDILINCAGILYRSSFSEIDIDEWKKVIDVNLNGTFYAMKACVPYMIKRRWGRIVNFSSTAGKSVSTLGGAHYTTSKAGVLGLTRAAAKELAPYDITVNAICPGLIDTPMVRKNASYDEIKKYIESFPIKRMGKPEEVAALVKFIISDDASYITGATLDINGGDLMI